ncbi:FecCD family ABC transporter permease [Streptomyces parvus]|uniref:FecCD family ABC transporter permease n=1 Tax=Streptomyces parvus TaxID=66428 RepID=UPI0034066EC4
MRRRDDSGRDGRLHDARGYVRLSDLGASRAPGLTREPPLDRSGRAGHRHDRRPARRRSAARNPQPEPTPVRSALRGGGRLVLTGLLLLLVVLSTWIGTKDTTLGQAWTALWNDDRSYATDVIRQLRLPRTLVGLMTGAALGAAGAVMQAVTRNPLADPGLLGVNAGASAAVVFGIGVVGLAGFGSLVWFSFVGAALTTVIVYVLGAAGRAGPTPVRLALAGAAVSASLSGVIAGLTVFDSATYDYLRFWMVGSLAGREPELVVQLLPFVAVGLVIALLLARPLNSLALGEELGRALGARIARTRIAAAVVAVTLLCGASTGPPADRRHGQPQPRGQSGLGGRRTALGRTPCFQPVLLHLGVGRPAGRMGPGGGRVPAQQSAAGGRHHRRAGRGVPRLGAVQAARHRDRVTEEPPGSESSGPPGTSLRRRISANKSSVKHVSCGIR